MTDDFMIDKNAFVAAKGMFDVIIGETKHIEEGDEVGLVKSLGYKAIFATRNLMFSPMTLSVFEMMGQNGVKNLFYRGGYHSGEIFAEETIESGMAKWDESLFKYHETMTIATGWGYLNYAEINLDPDNPRIVSKMRNHPCATTVPEIMKYAVQKNPGLEINFNQTFCDYHTGWILAILRLIMEKNGADIKFLSRLRGREEYCQVQEGHDHCKHVIGIFE